MGQAPSSLATIPAKKRMVPSSFLVQPCSAQKRLWLTDKQVQSLRRIDQQMAKKIVQGESEMQRAAATFEWFRCLRAGCESMEGEGLPELRL